MRQAYIIGSKMEVNQHERFIAEPITVKIILKGIGLPMPRAESSTSVCICMYLCKIIITQTLATGFSKTTI
jgi:hypothetical protein